MDFFTIFFKVARAQTIFPILVFSTLIPNIAFADCYVTWNCGGSSQCAQLYGGSSGRRGPFPSCAGYVQRDAVSSCSCGAGGGGAVALPPSGDPATAIGTALGNMLFDALTSPSQPKTPEQIEAERQAELAREQAERERQQKIQNYVDEEARKKREKDAALDKEAEDALLLASPHVAAAAEPLSDSDLISKKTAAFTKGFEDGSGCFSQNAGPRCSGVTADQQQACVTDYRNGYEEGDKQRKVSMDEAYHAGRTAGAGGGDLSSGVADPRAQGPCRTSWIDNYSRGFIEGKPVQQAK
jgi:hypothetical protein